MDHIDLESTVDPDSNGVRILMVDGSDPYLKCARKFGLQSMKHMVDIGTNYKVSKKMTHIQIGKFEKLP